MIGLNILPEELKLEIKAKKASISVIGMFILSFIIVGLTYELLFTTKKLLTNNLESLEEQKNAYEEYFDTDKNKAIEDVITEANILFVNINKIQNNRVSWTDILIQLSDITPEGIRINSLELDRELNVVNISGNASKREVLLRYMELLQNYKFFKEINLPSEYLINAENINFEINTTFDSQNIYKE